MLKCKALHPESLDPSDEAFLAFVWEDEARLTPTLCLINSSNPSLFASNSQSQPQHLIRKLPDEFYVVWGLYFSDKDKPDPTVLNDLASNYQTRLRPEDQYPIDSKTHLNNFLTVRFQVEHLFDKLPLEKMAQDEPSYAISPFFQKVSSLVNQPHQYGKLNAVMVMYQEPQAIYRERAQAVFDELSEMPLLERFESYPSSFKQPSGGPSIKARRVIVAKSIPAPFGTSTRPQSVSIAKLPLSPDVTKYIIYIDQDKDPNPGFQTNRFYRTSFTCFKYNPADSAQAKLVAENLKHDNSLGDVSQTPFLPLINKLEAMDCFQEYGGQAFSMARPDDAQTLGDLK